MTKQDLYCFKEGKLELSILDEVLDENSDSASDEKGLNSQDIELPPLQEIQLKISEEVYHTLKTMGEFLTQPEMAESQESVELLEVVEAATLPQTQQITKTSQFINRETYAYKEEALGQSSIDKLLLSHFGELKPRFKYADELKNKIDMQIKKIKSNK